MNRPTKAERVVSLRGEGCNEAEIALALGMRRDNVHRILRNGGHWVAPQPLRLHRLALAAMAVPA